MTTKLAVLFSGGGTTILNLLSQIEDKKLDAEIILSIASRNDIIGIDRLAERGIDVAIAKQDGDTTETVDRKIQAWLDNSKPDLILLCGYLRFFQLKPWMEGRVLNIHPALLPNFGGKGMYGLNVHKSVIEHGEKTSGCTVHYVDDKYDHGPIIIQKTCDVLENDTPETLAKRVFELECIAYPEAIRLVASQLNV
jgi:phosphoribosylglycinamide formyltransferase-1